MISLYAGSERVEPAKRSFYFVFKDIEFELTSSEFEIWHLESTNLMHE